MEKRYNFRIYPNKEQEQLINVNFGCSRFVYNYFLAKQIKNYQQNGTFIGLYDTTKELPELKRTEGYEWLKDSVAEALSYSLCDLDNAFKMFFKRVKQGNVAPGFPKFKSKRNSFQSYRCKNKTPKPPKMASTIEVSEKAIKLPKLGWVDCRVSRKVEGRILNATVIKNPSGKYFVSVYCTDVCTAPLPKTEKAIGLHLGVEHLVVTSDGEKYENHRYLEKSRKKLSRLHKQLSRKTSGSSNREKARIKLARAYEKITNQKTDALHKMTTAFVRECDTICVRDIPVAESQQNPIYSRFMPDVSWGELLRQLSYKCEWYGKEFVKTEQLFPCAQICSGCGHKNSALKPHQRKWACPKCGTHHDRGKNTAINILNEGLKRAIV